MYSKHFCHYLLFCKLNDDVVLSYDKRDQCERQTKYKTTTFNEKKKLIVTHVRSQLKPNPLSIH